MKKMAEGILLPYIYVSSGGEAPKNIRMTPQSINKKLRKAPVTRKKLLQALSTAGVDPKDLVPDREFFYDTKIHYTSDLISKPDKYLSTLLHEKGHGVSPSGIKGEIEAWDYAVKKLGKKNLGPRESASLGTHLIMNKLRSGNKEVQFREAASSVLNSIDNMSKPIDITDELISQESRLDKLQARRVMENTNPVAKQNYARNVAKEIHKEVKKTGLKPAPKRDIEKFFLNEIYKLEKSGLPNKYTPKVQKIVPKTTLASKLLKALKKIK